MILAGCCGDMLAVVIGRAASSRFGNNAVVILLLKDLRVPSHVILLRNGCQRQRQRHLHARLLVSDPEYLLDNPKRAAPLRVESNAVIIPRAIFVCRHV